MISENDIRNIIFGYHFCYQIEEKLYFFQNTEEILIFNEKHKNVKNTIKNTTFGCALFR